MSTTGTYVANLGKLPNRPAPPNLDHMFHEQEGPIPLLLVILPVTGSNMAHGTRDQHWLFQWTIPNVKYTIVRQAHVTQERDSTTGDLLPHLTNWGAIVRTEGQATSKHATKVPIQDLSLAQRMAFLRISDNEGVRHPNGQWNCQDWCKSVLAKAVAANILTKENVDRAIGMAQSTLLTAVQAI